jgi:hypothetical protein
LRELDKANGTPLDSVAVSSTSAVLSPSDDVTELFGIDSTILVRINVDDGTVAPVAGALSITVK